LRQLRAHELGGGRVVAQGPVLVVAAPCGVGGRVLRTADRLGADDFRAWT
jgi:hypothetical protein